MGDMNGMPGIRGGTWTPGAPNGPAPIPPMPDPMPAPAPPSGPVFGKRKMVPGYADGTSKVIVAGQDATSEVPSERSSDQRAAAYDQSIMSMLPKFTGGVVSPAPTPAPAATVASAPAQAAQTVLPPGSSGSGKAADMQGVSPWLGADGKLIPGDRPHATPEMIARWGSEPPADGSYPHPATHSFDDAVNAFAKMPFGKFMQLTAMLPKPQAIDPMTQLHSQILGLTMQKHQAAIAQQTAFDSQNGVSEADHNKNILAHNDKLLDALRALATNNLPAYETGLSMAAQRAQQQQQQE